MSRRVLLSLVHDRVVMAAIVANTVVLTLHGFPEVKAAHGPLLFWIEYAFTAYFVFEMVVKLTTAGPRAFWDFRWNRFDLIIVLLSTPVLIAPWWESHDFGFILVVRCARLLRLLRGLRFIPDRDRLWGGIRRALRASVGVFIWLVVYNLILGIMAHSLFSEVAPRYFANPVLSMYSLLKVFTVEGWYEIPDHIARVGGVEMGLLARGFFIFAVTTGGILGLSLANAVFIDEMVMDNNDELETEVGKLREQVSTASAEQHEQLTALREQLDALLARLEPR